MIALLIVGSFLLLLGLKLLGQIDWSWWWVTAPLWGAGIGWIVGLLAFGVVTIALALGDSKRKRTAHAAGRAQARHR